MPAAPRPERVLAATTADDVTAMLACRRCHHRRQAYQRFSSALWGEDEVRKLHAELAEIASAASEITAPEPPAPLRPASSFPDSATRSGLAEFGFPLAGRADWALAVKTAGGGAAILGATEAQGAAT